MSNQSDIAYMDGRRAFYEGLPRRSHPEYRDKTLLKEWLAGYNNAQNEKIQQNLKAIGK